MHFWIGQSITLKNFLVLRDQKLAGTSLQKMNFSDVSVMSSVAISYHQEGEIKQVLAAAQL